MVSEYGRSYEVKKCTKKSLFDVGLVALANPSIVVTSVLSNFLCDAGGLVDSSSHLTVLSSVITEHVQKIKTHAASNPTSRYVIVPPLP